MGYTAVQFGRRADISEEPEHFTLDLDDGGRMYFRNAGSQCRNTACHRGTNGDNCLVFGVTRL